MDAILQLFPLDSYAEKPVILMDLLPGDTVKTPIWDVYKEIISKYEPRGAAVVGAVSRSDFYDEARKAYAIIATGEKALYANIMLQKGVVSSFFISILIFFRLPKISGAFFEKNIFSEFVTPL